MSFDLSINAPRTSEEARRLLSLLGQLPDGIAHEDLDALVPDVGADAAATLRKVGLAFDEGGRLRVLQPLRDHVRAKYAPRDDDLVRAIAHYCALTEMLGWRLGGAGGGEASRRLLVERGNLDAMIGRGLGGEDPKPAIRAALAFGEFLRYGGVGTPELLEVAADTAGNLGDAGLEAITLHQLGMVAVGRFDYDTAQARFEEAQPLYEQVGDFLGQANCLTRLDDVALARFDYDTA